ncbi:MAG TPA: TRAP transporter substrate-binding protein [Thermodesulfobacteriota bacterium]|nr:TRAP transporter substrate-binding protein [Thermodesulfobacteriota bacterium]
MVRARALAATLVALLAGAAAAGAADQPVVLRLGHVGFPNSLFDISTTEFARRVNAELRGRVEVKVFHSSQLGTDEQMVRGVRIGAPELFLPSTIMSTVEPKFGVFEMPYLIVGREHMKRVAEHPAVQQALFAGLPAKGMRVLGVWENGFRHITNNVRPIAKPEDLRGIKLRVPGGVWRVKMFQAYGANPSPMAFAEVYSALQAGVMDGQENPLSQIWSGRLHEVQKFLSLSGHVYTPAYLVIGEEVWQRLAPDVRATLARIAREVGDFARREGERLDRELIGQMGGAIRVNEVDKEAFIKASAAIYEQFGREVPGGAELIRTIQGLR